MLTNSPTAGVPIFPDPTLLIASVEAAIARGCRHYSGRRRVAGDNECCDRMLAARGLRHRRGTLSVDARARTIYVLFPGPPPERIQQGGPGEV